MQTGFKDGCPGQIHFNSLDSLVTMRLDLNCRGGLYYCPTDIFTVDRLPVHQPAINHSLQHHPLPHPESQPLIQYTVPVPKMAINTSKLLVQRLRSLAPPVTLRCPSRFTPTSKSKQVESEVWLLCLGSPGVHQLDVLPGNVTGLPSVFEYHPFRFIDFKEQARIEKQAAQRSVVRTTDCRQRYYMDFGFMHASTLDYSHPQKGKDRVVCLYDGFTLYLLIVDEATQYVWVFLTASKEPPLAIVSKFLRHHGHEDRGSICTNQGGKLACSFEFQDLILQKFYYTLEPTGADSPSQNGPVEIYNDKFAVRTCTLLFGSGLSAEYWSAVLLHLVYLHN
jgi:hypothetical protein